MADLYVNAEEYDLAEPLYRLPPAAKPNDPEPRDGWADCCCSSAVFPRPSRTCCRTSAEAQHGDRDGDLAAAANENKNYELVIKALDARAKLLPELPIGDFLRATAYDHLRQDKLVAENYDRFLETATGNFPTRNGQARHRLITIEPRK